MIYNMFGGMLNPAQSIDLCVVCVHACVAVMLLFHVVHVSSQTCIEQLRHVCRQHLHYVQGS